MLWLTLMRLHIAHEIMSAIQHIKTSALTNWSPMFVPRFILLLLAPIHCSFSMEHCLGSTQFTNYTLTTTNYKTTRSKNGFTPLTNPPHIKCFMRSFQRHFTYRGLCLSVF